MNGSRHSPIDPIANKGAQSARTSTSLGIGRVDWDCGEGTVSLNRSACNWGRWRCFAGPTPRPVGRDVNHKLDKETLELTMSMQLQITYKLQ